MQMKWSKLGTRRKIDEMWKIVDLTNRVLKILVDTSEKDEEWKRLFGFEMHFDIYPHKDEPDMLRYIGKYKKPSLLREYNRWVKEYSESFK